ncbi:MAG: enoyl-CoA hydratase-related protein [Rhodospirillales bacterium]|nr:enoyl-CoA hydratase-related protein [Rhodospirillales bacterium]MDP6643206.1 enoyl-CoA hydratase-related protein [Rhodospirillales bacterium]
MATEEKDYILYEIDNRIGTVTINRPEALNSLCWPLMEKLKETLLAAEKDPEVGVIILRGAGRCFSAGYDFTEGDPVEMKRGEGPAEGTHEPRGVPQYGRGVWNSRAHVQDHINYDQLIFNLWKPVIAQVHGFAYAGASTLALACDLTIMASDAKLGYPPTRWLATGDNVGLYSFLAGLKKAREMSYGRMFDGKQCVEYGLANYHYPEDELAERTLEIAREIAAIEPELLMLNKMVVNRTWEIMGLRTAMEVAGEFDTICHLAHTTKPLVDQLKATDGNLRQALKNLNAPWGGL